MEYITCQQSQNCFASLGSTIGDTYVVNQHCLTILDDINCELSSEDKSLRIFRRTIGFSQALKKDFLPLLSNAKDNEIINSIVRILVNLSAPVECLLPMDVMSKTDVGRMIIFELNSFLISSKEAFLDARATRLLVDHMKKLIELGDDKTLTNDECEGVNNCLLLLRNILHVPETRIVSNNAHCTIQNQIVWNLFIQNIDKILIHLMTCKQKAYWGVTMVQLIAIMYKDQHVGTLQKLLNVWFEASLSESSEDNESNTSPPEQGSEDSSPMLTSDFSDTGGSGKNNSTSNDDDDNASGVPHIITRSFQQDSPQETNKNTKSKRVTPTSERKNNDNSSSVISSERKSSLTNTGRKNVKGCMLKRQDTDSGVGSMCSFDSESSKVSSVPHNHQKPKSQTDSTTHKRGSLTSEMSDCGYATLGENSSSASNNQLNVKSESDSLFDKRGSLTSETSGYATLEENPELVSTSSNEEETPQAKRNVHQKPHTLKTRYVNKQLTPLEKKENRRKKLVKRSKTTIMNMKAMAHHVPTDEDITHLLKEFTVDFLLKAYGPLVQVLHSQLMKSHDLVQVDTSHFFWLVTYFLKFSTQLELDLEHILEVLDFDIISYLVYEGVNICESLELCLRQTGDLKPYLRRQHLVVTAIREFIQAIDTYKKATHLSQEDKEFLHQLQVQISSSNDLKCLFVLLLRLYDPSIQNKQYLQDLVVTNHILLTFLEETSRDVKFSTPMIVHINQFATVEVMRQYGLLLEDFETNGEFINDCVFTMMHHIAGDVNQVASLFQPNILKTFAKIWEGDYQLCDDWSDLIEYVINRFVNLPKHCPVIQSGTILSSPTLTPAKDSSWSTEDCENLYWYFVQSSTDKDPISNIIKFYEDNGVNKTRVAVIEQLLQQSVISDAQHQYMIEGETLHSAQTIESKKELHFRESFDQSERDADEINNLKDLLIKDDWGDQLCWLQRLLIETCYVKIVTDMDTNIKFDTISKPLEPVPHYYSLLNQSIPVVPWNSGQSGLLVQKRFQLLLHKLGFHLPADTGKIFARIPNFWTADVLFSVSQKLGPIDPSSLKFDLKCFAEQLDLNTNIDSVYLQQENNYSYHFSTPHQKVAPSMIRFTPAPNLSSNWLDIGKVSKSALDLPILVIDKDNNENRKYESEIIKNEEKDNEMEDLDAASVCSVCETNRESVASDLMCVSECGESLSHDTAMPADV